MQSLYLRDERAWCIHQDTKESPFLTLLPRLLEATKRGECPDAQRGVSGIQFDEWATA